MSHVIKRAGASLLLITLIIANVWTLIPPASLSSGSSDTTETSSAPEMDFSLLLSAASDPVLIPIIIAFDRPVQAEDLAIFEDLGGELTHGPWSSAISGFAGTIIDSQIPALQAALPNAIVERDQAVTTSLNAVSRLARGRNFTWDTLGLNGTSNGTIAILDTGINASHPAFIPGYESFNWEKTIISWNDTVNGNPDPYDDNAHGSFIASVIASRGFTTESATGSMVANFTANLTHQGLFGGGGVMGGWYRYKLLSVNVTEANTTITANAKYFEFSASQVLEFQFEWRNISQATVASATASLTGVPYEVSYNVTTHPGVYDLYIHYRVPEASTFTFSVDAEALWHCALQTDAYLNSTGVAPGSKLAVVKVLDCNGAGSFASVIDGLNWVKANKTASHIVAVCLSMESTDLALPESLDILNNTINQVIAEGILVVVAAGNKGVIPNALNRIALNPKVLVVGATNENDEVTYYSSQGETVGGQIKPDLVAPGGSLLPAHVPVYGASNWSNQLIAMEGTSIAAAVVAGAVNILLQAIGSYESNWTDSQVALDVKSRLLMTATETNLQREDDPATPADESLSSPTLSRGNKDIHEGYGRLNIDAAAESYLFNMTPTMQERGNLTSSTTSPQGKHAWARRVLLYKNQPYLLNLSVPLTGDFDLYLYHNYSDEFGEPRLLAKSVRAIAGTEEQISFTPSNETREYLLVVKAVSGSGEFALNISLLDNYSPPEIQAIWMVSDDPGTNNTWSTYTVYINYTDADNNPPVSVTLSITNATMGFSYAQNYTMTAQTPGNQNFTVNATYYRSYDVEVPEDYRIYVRVFDGIYYNESVKLTQHVDAIMATPYPYTNDFYYNYPGRGVHWLADDAIENWTYTPSGIDLNRWYFHYASPYPQIVIEPTYYLPDYNSLEYKPYWHFSRPYFGGTTVWDYSENLDMSLYTPYIFLEGATNPVARVGIRVSMALGDFFYVDIQENNSAWTTLQLYTATEIDWTELEFNLTAYKESYVRLRFRCTTDGVEDSLRNKGVIIDSVSFAEFDNDAVPVLSDPFASPFFHRYVEPQAGSRFQKYRFNVIYTDDHMPTYVYLEMAGINHTMYNNQVDVWKPDHNRWNPSGGILYTANITVTDFSSRQYRFHASDGMNVVSTGWFTDGPTVQGYPQPIGFPFQENFTGSGYESWYVAGTPDKMEKHDWLKTNTSWDIVNDPFGTPSYFWYCGVQTVIWAQRYYGPNWDASLVTKPIQVDSPQDVHLYFTHMLNFDYPWGEDQAFVDISTDYGRTFTTLMTFGGFDYTGFEWQDIDIDISKYNHSNITLRFRFVSDNVPTNPMIGLNMGWRLSHIEVNASVEIIAPVIVLQQPDTNYELIGTVRLNFTITDNTQVDTEHLQLYINNELVTPTIWVDPQNQNVQLSYIWDTKETSNGLIRIRIVALDTYGNTRDITYNTYVNNPFDWFALLFWIIVIAAIAVFAAIVYKTNFFKTTRDRSKAAKKMQITSSATKSAKTLGIPVIADDMVNETVEAQEVFTLYCKNCKKEFHSEKFEWMCPSCDKDSLFLKTYCLYCGTPALLEDPRKAYCKKCGSRLLRQPNKIVNQIREAMGVGAEGTTAAAAKKREYPVITDNMVNEEEEAKEILTLKCKKCGTTYESDRFMWTCPKCQGDSLYLRSKCLHCDKEILLDSPRKNRCDKCGSRLLRQPERWAAKHIDLEFKKGGENA